MKKGLIVFSLLLAAMACGKSNSNSDNTYEGDVYVFPGVRAYERFDDASVTLMWETVPSTSVAYQVFRRELDGTYNWDQPFLKVEPKGSLPAPSSVHFAEENKKICYVVQIALEHFEDNNRNEVCAEPLID